MGSQGPPGTGTKQVALRLMRIGTAEIWVDHAYVADSINRTIVLRSRQHQRMLGKGRQTELDSLDRSLEGVVIEELAHTLVSLTVQELQRLGAMVSDTESRVWGCGDELEQGAGREDTEACTALVECPDTAVAPTALEVQQAEGGMGMLVYAGRRPGAEYVLEIRTDGGDYRQISGGHQLEEALSASGARPMDRVRVIREDNATLLTAGTEARPVHRVERLGLTSVVATRSGDGEWDVLDGVVLQETG